MTWVKMHVIVVLRNSEKLREAMTRICRNQNHSPAIESNMGSNKNTNRPNTKENIRLTE